MAQRVRVGLGLAVVAGVVVAWAAGLFDWVTHERIHALLAESGAWGPIFYVLAFALLEPFGVPGAVFILPASLAWPTEVAVALSVLGATLAGVVAFALARSVVGSAVEHRLPLRVRRFTATAREHPLRSVIAVRLLFGLAAPAHWALALSGIRFVPFVLGSLVGFVPLMWLLVVFGRELIEWLERQPDARVWPIALAFALGAYLAYRAWFRRPPRSLREPPNP